MGGTTPHSWADEGAALLHPRARRGWGAFRQAQDVVVRRARQRGLIDAAPIAAVDATGLETRHVSAYFGLRRGSEGHRQRAWPKLTAVVHAHSHLILGAVPGVGPSQDSPDFTPAMRQAAALIRIDTVLGDAGYDAEHNHRLCRAGLGVRQTVIRLNRRNTGRRWPKTPYRRAMRHRFPKVLHNRRWHAESGFSQHKRRLGSALTARGDDAQARELVLRVLTHNLMLLAEAV
jgi:Transposase DDE domain